MANRRVVVPAGAVIAAKPVPSAAEMSNEVSGPTSVPNGEHGRAAAGRGRGERSSSVSVDSSMP